jgi:hypothetical protein
MLDQTDNGPDTIKIDSGALKVTNEREYAQFKYDQARAEMLKDPTEENLEKFLAANKYLTEVEDSYRIAGKLLIQHAVSQMT